MAHAHLNGSLNLGSAEKVFRTVSEISGDTVERIPDGETGERLGWIAALVPKLRVTPALVEGTRSGYGPASIFGLRAGTSTGDLGFPLLGYAAAARSSYEVFRDLRDDGVILPGVRFQVSLPTVTAAVEPFIAEPDRDRVEPAYARRLESEVAAILGAIPHRDLAMQWDVAVEMGILEGVFPTRFADPFREVVERLTRLSCWVPADVPLGYHLCYGDAQEVSGQGEGRHWKEPEDTTRLVELANAVTRRATRSMAWFSIPVPIDRDDDAYFEPLVDLDLDPETRLYLGLVHHQDGVEGAQRRIETARRYVSDFGVATECGMGRRPSEHVPTLLRIQREARV